MGSGIVEVNANNGWRNLLWGKKKILELA